VAGGSALIAGTLAWVLPARPYEAPWAWICFIGMCLIDDYLLGSPAKADWGQLPKVVLFAAIIMFRRHPEITMLVTLVAAPLGSALKGQRWSTQVSATAQWMLAAVVGAAAFRAVGFEDTAHFVGVTDWVGRKVSFEHAANGKVFLAYGTSPPKDLAHVRARGFATSIDELELGLSALAAPVFGPQVRFVLLGSKEISGETLLRWYVLHVLMFPFVIVIFMAVHFWRVRKDGGLSGPL